MRADQQQTPLRAGCRALGDQCLGSNYLSKLEIDLHRAGGLVCLGSRFVHVCTTA